MDRLFDLLYDACMENFKETLSPLDEEEQEAYRQCVKVLNRQAAKLAAALTPETVEKYDDLWAEQGYYTNHAAFRQGLSAGLRLGALALFQSSV